MEHRNIGHTSGKNSDRVEAVASLPQPGIAEFLAAMLTSSDQETVWSLTCDFFAELGFGHVLYGYSPDSRGSVLGAPEDYLLLSTLPHDVVTTLVEKQYFRMSVTFGWALQNAGIASWSMTPGDAGLSPELEVTEDALVFFERNSLVTGCSIGFPQERTRGRAVMALSAPSGVTQREVDARLESSRDVIFTVAAVAHRCLTSLPYHLPGRRLTQRQREVLEWVGEGKTTADIAQIMGITSPTVEKHLRLARETLGVETTAHALIKAAFLNQVFVPTPMTPGKLTSVTPFSA